ncbi:MAG: hypothetical protein RIS94_2144 [Pseudomonadota bacterium]|jgi:spore coat protein U-like protein
MRPTLPRLALAAALAAAFAATPARAACVLCSCSANAANIAFGSYDPSSATPRDANANLTVSCSTLVSILGSVDVALSAGQSGIASTRKMAKGTDTLTYYVYDDAAHTVILGTGSGGTNLLQLSIAGIISISTSATLYGRIPARQWVRAGAYADTLTVTVTY